MRRKYVKCKMRLNADKQLERSCTACNAWFPATTEYFHRCRRNKGGLASHCKLCNNNQRASNRAKAICDR